MNRNADDTTRAELHRLELLLMDPAVRRDRAQVAALLDEDFVEFGSSGRVWTRETILELLATGTFTPPAVEEFACSALGPGVMLVTYRAVWREDAGERNATLRSSIWTRESGSWKMRFHQGTRESQ